MVRPAKRSVEITGKVLGTVKSLTGAQNTEGAGWPGVERTTLASAPLPPEDHGRNGVCTD